MDNPVLDELKNNLKLAQNACAVAEDALAAYICAPENNIYYDLDDAICEIENRLEVQASNDCEGSHNRGSDEYHQDFTVNGKLYRGTLTVEYNRHDKTYYYIDSSVFVYKELN